MLFGHPMAIGYQALQLAPIKLQEQNTGKNRGKSDKSRGNEEFETNEKREQRMKEIQTVHHSGLLCRCGIGSSHSIL